MRDELVKRTKEEEADKDNDGGIVVPLAVELFVEKRGENGLDFFIAFEGVVDARLLAPADAIPVRNNGRRSGRDGSRELTGVVWGGWRGLVVVLDGDCWDSHETCSRQKRVQGNTWSVVQGALNCAGCFERRAGCFERRASVVQDVLGVVHDILSRALSHVLLSLP